MTVRPGEDGSTSEAARLGHLNLIEVSRESTRWGTGGALEESDGVVLFATGSWSPVSCNGAFRSDDTAAPGELLERADAFFAARRRGYSVKVRDTPADDDLRQACRAAGLETFGQPAPEMIRRTPVAEDGPDGVEIRTITAESGIADFAAVMGDAYAVYGMPVDTTARLLSLPRRVLAAPHLATVVAYEEGVAVAGAMTFLSHGIAGLYWVGTVEKARGSGLGRAVTAAVTNISFARGAAAVTLQASAMGEPVYRRLGFGTLYHYEDWVRLPAPPA